MKSFVAISAQIMPSFRGWFWIGYIMFTVGAILETIRLIFG
jgi:hypothetical protein